MSKRNNIGETAGVEIKSFNGFQLHCVSTSYYPGQGTEAGLDYCVHGVTEEAGEIAGVQKKFLRKDYGDTTRKRKMIEEMGDELFYLAKLATELGTTLSAIANLNIRKRERLARTRAKKRKQG